LFARSFPNTHSISLKKSSTVPYDYLFLLTSFLAFSDLIDLKERGGLHFRFLCHLTLFLLCFFSLFLDIIKSSAIKKELLFFSIEYYLGVFCTGLTFFKSPEKVIISGEVSEGSTVLTVLNGVSAEVTGDRF